jgi:hypothetical protein
MTQSIKSHYQWIYVFTALIVSAMVLFIYLSINQLGGSGDSSFSRMLQGTANYPVIYRTLVPSLAKAGAAITPAWVSESLKNVSSESMPGKAIHQLSGGSYFTEALYALLLMYFSVAGFVLVERELLKDLGYPLQLQLALPVFLTLLTLPFSVHFAYVYDLPQLFLTSLGCLFLLRKQWIAFLITLAVSTLNKETSLFLTIIFALYYFQRLPIRRFLMLLASQLVIFGVIRTLITHLYLENPGVPFFWSINEHIAQYTKYPVTLIFTILFLGMFLYMILRNWSLKPLFLRYASSVFFLTLMLFFIGGMPMEFRIFLDTLPIFGIMLFPHRQELHSQLRENQDRSSLNETGVIQ